MTFPEKIKHRDAELIEEETTNSKKTNKQNSIYQIMHKRFINFQK